jgi:hypothetical protein
VREALRAARERRQIQAVLADAGYDAEWVHQFIRDELDMRSFIPPTAGRPTDKPPAGRYRRAMRTYFRRPKQRRRYGQRWQVETVFSMIKRRLGECVNACSDRRQRRAMLLKAIVHNILILLLIRPFLQSSCVPVFTPFSHVVHVFTRFHARPRFHAAEHGLVLRSPRTLAQAILNAALAVTQLLVSIGAHSKCLRALTM